MIKYGAHLGAAREDVGIALQYHQLMARATSSLTAHNNVAESSSIGFLYLV